MSHNHARRLSDASTLLTRGSRAANIHAVDTKSYYRKRQSRGFKITDASRMDERSARRHSLALSEKGDSQLSNQIPHERKSVASRASQVRGSARRSPRLGDDDSRVHRRHLDTIGTHTEQLQDLDARLHAVYKQIQALRSHMNRVRQSKGRRWLDAAAIRRIDSIYTALDSWSPTSGTSHNASRLYKVCGEIWFHRTFQSLGSSREFDALRGEALEQLGFVLEEDQTQTELCLPFLIISSIAFDDTQQMDVIALLRSKYAVRNLSHKTEGIYAFCKHMWSLMGNFDAFWGVEWLGVLPRNILRETLAHHGLVNSVRSQDTSLSDSLGPSVRTTPERYSPPTFNYLNPPTTDHRNIEHTVHPFEASAFETPDVDMDSWDVEQLYGDLRDEDPHVILPTASSSPGVTSRREADSWNGYSAFSIPQEGAYEPVDRFAPTHEGSGTATTIAISSATSSWPQSMSDYDSSHVRRRLSRESSVSTSMGRTRSPRSQRSLERCTVCDYKPRNPSDKRRHELTHEKPFYCEVPHCSRVDGFASRTDLERHQKTVHARSNSGYVCKACSEDGTGEKKVWPRRDNFKAHIARKHPDADLETLLKTSRQSQDHQDAATEEYSAEATKPWTEGSIVEEPFSFNGLDLDRVFATTSPAPNILPAATDAILSGSSEAERLMMDGLDIIQTEWESIETPMAQ